MRLLSPVVWREGMHLAQHHFQAQSRYFEDSIEFALSQLFHSPYGLAACELDAEALLNGTAAFKQARGVMPDGLPFQFPDVDPCPAALKVGRLFSPTDNSRLLYLTIPGFRSGSQNCLLDDGPQGSVRYSAEPISVIDDTTGTGAKAITMGRKNFRLALDTDLDEGTVALPIARIQRDGTGQFVYDDHYIPPCLSIGASHELLELLGRLVQVLQARGESLANDRGGSERAAGAFAGGDVASFWMSHAINSSLGPLRHHLATRQSRPEEVFLELSRLAGALCTFSLEADPGALPIYDHDDLESSYLGLEQHIRRHLEVSMPTKAILVPLPARSEQGFYGTFLKDDRLFGPGEWVIGVKARAREEEIIQKVPALVKICSGDGLQRLLKEGKGGLELRYLPSPPVEVAPRLGTHYFRVEQTGFCWKAIHAHRSIAAHVPSSLPDVEMELSVILNEGS